MSDSILRVLKISAAAFLVVLGLIAISVWVSDESRELPFDYEGFD